MAPGKTICALADAAAIPAHLMVKHFRADLEEHIRDGGCKINKTGKCAAGHSHKAPATEKAEAQA
jgi:hypothetical protein